MFISETIFMIPEPKLDIMNLQACKHYFLKVIRCSRSVGVMFSGVMFSGVEIKGVLLVLKRGLPSCAAHPQCMARMNFEQPAF